MKMCERLWQSKWIRRCSGARDPHSQTGRGLAQPTEAIRLDNGPEFIAERFIAWCAERTIEVRHIQPGKPDQNALIERYNRTHRTEVLNAAVFESLKKVREISAEWLQSYNEERPHDALAGLQLAMYRANLETRSSPPEVSP